MDALAIQIMATLGFVFGLAGLLLGILAHSRMGDHEDVHKKKEAR